MRVERRALLNGVDHTASLTRLGVPIEGRDGRIPMFDALSHLAPADQERLAALGLIERFSEPGTPGRNAVPRWTVKETWHWEQTFPVGRDLVVEHRYRPGVGGTVATALGSAEIRTSDYGRETIARYCIDDDLLAAVERIGRRNEKQLDPARRDLAELHPRHRRQLAFADRRLPPRRRQGRSECVGQLLRRGRPPHLAYPVRGPPPQLATDTAISTSSSLFRSAAEREVGGGDRVRVADVERQLEIREAVAVRVGLEQVGAFVQLRGAAPGLIGESAGIEEGERFVGAAGDRIDPGHIDLSPAAKSGSRRRGRLSIA